MSEIQQFEEGTTLDRFIFETTRVHHGAQGQFATLLQQMALAARLVSARVNRAGLAGILGATGEQNIQGEFVQKLDIATNPSSGFKIRNYGIPSSFLGMEIKRTGHKVKIS